MEERTSALTTVFLGHGHVRDANTELGDEVGGELEVDSKMKVSR